MMTEYKYYLEKFNKMLEDKENHYLILSYLNSPEKNDNSKIYKIGSEVKKNILTLLSTTNNTLFSKNYTQNIIDKVNYIEAHKQKIINKDIENQEENFKERLKGKNSKLIEYQKSSNNELTSNSHHYFSENIKKNERRKSKVIKSLIKLD